MCTHPYFLYKAYPIKTHRLYRLIHTLGVVQAFLNCRNLLIDAGAGIFEGINFFKSVQSCCMVAPT